MRYKVVLRRGEARASFVMDHGRVGPPGIFGGEDGAPNHIEIVQKGKVSTPLHLSKDQDVALSSGDYLRVRTPGGGGYGDPTERLRELSQLDRLRGYLSRDAS